MLKLVRLFSIKSLVLQVKSPFFHITFTLAFCVILHEFAGILSGTTRLLVTHNPAVLQFMDSVVVVKDGAVVDQGTYTDLVESGGLAGLLAEGGQGQGVDGERSQRKDAVKKGDSGPLEEVESDSARLTEDEEALTGKVSDLPKKKIDFTSLM